MATCGIFVAALAGLAAAPSRRVPELEIVHPGAGDSIPGPDLVVRLRVADVELGGRERNGAYVMLRLDDLPPIKSYAERFTFRGVSPGDHRLRAELLRPDGTGFDPQVTAQVRFEISGRQAR